MPKPRPKPSYPPKVPYLVAISVRANRHKRRPHWNADWKKSFKETVQDVHHANLGYIQGRVEYADDVATFVVRKPSEAIAIVQAIQENTKRAKIFFGIARGAAGFDDGVVDVHKLVKEESKSALSRAFNRKPRDHVSVHGFAASDDLFSLALNLCMGRRREWSQRQWEIINLCGIHGNPQRAGDALGKESCAIRDTYRTSLHHAVVALETEVGRHMDRIHHDLSTTL